MSELLPNENTGLVTTSTITNNNNGEDSKSRENGNALGGPLSTSVSSLASSSGASVKSGIPKPFSIKPASHSGNPTISQSASRIGRLCGNQHKPSLPSSPVQSNALDKIMDDYGKHRLTDVMEEEIGEDGKFSTNNLRKRNYSIGSTASSIDHLWDVHPRRLSEAGLTRNTDSSAVLTEDTDSFIIGQKVWVSGTKPGHIAFIGETQFAPGDWAGIALDEPIGKNDGSVGGIKYFQCEPKKGVFARLTRLTRFPLAQEGMGSGETCTSLVGNNVRRSPVSPTGSTRGNLKSPISITGSNISLASAASHVIDYKIGDRVIIKSSQGSKVGTVRYIGSTEFANGEWVGVELDEPRGKNDGSVNGKRYFECRQNFGLFAPVSKVSKSPSKVKPNACQIHPSTGLPPSGILKRTNSKESMLSNLSMTSVSSNVRRVRLGVTSLTPKKVTPKASSTPIPTRTALQDVLKEKQLHIEQLLKERDLERAEIMKAANQAEEAEQRLTALQQEYMKYRSECEIQLQDHITLLNKLKEDRSELVTQLDEEKRKNEDLTFRLAEFSISKEDVEVANETIMKRLRELEEKLQRERDKVESLESDANKLFEAEENLIRAKEEIEQSRKQLQETRDKQIILEGDNASTSVLIATLQKEVDQYKSDAEESGEMISVLKQEITKVTAELKKEIHDTLKQKTEIDALCSEKTEEIKKMKLELDQVNVFLQNKINELEKVTVEKLASDTAFEKEIEKLKMNISSKTFDLENALQVNKDKQNEIKKMQGEIELIRNHSELKTNDLEEFKIEMAQQMSEKNTLLDDYQQQNSSLQDQIKVLTSELEKTKLNLDVTESNTKEAFSKLIEEKQEQINQLEIRIQETYEQNLEISNKYNELKIDLEIKCKELESLKGQNELLKKSVNELNSRILELQQDSFALKEKESLIQSLQTELQTTKVDLESVRNNLSQYQTNMSDIESNLNKERDDLKESLKAKIVQLEDIKSRFSETISQKDVQLKDVSIALSQKQEEIKKNNEDMEAFTEKNDRYIQEIVEKHTVEMKNKNEYLSNLQHELTVKDNKINYIELELKQLKENLEQELLEKKHFREALECKIKENELTSDVVKKTKKEIEQLTENKMQIQEKYNDSEKRLLKLEELSKKHMSDLESKINEIQQNESTIKQKSDEISALNDHISKLQETCDQATKCLENYQNNFNDVELKLKKDRDDLQESVESKTKELELIKQQMNEKLSCLGKTLSESNLECEKKSQEVVVLSKKNTELLDEINSIVRKTNDFFNDATSKENLSVISDCLTKWEETVVNKENEITGLKEEMKNMSGQYETVDKNNYNLQQKLNQLSEDNTESKKLLSECQNVIKVLTDENEKLKLELNNVSLSSTKLSDKISALSRQIEIQEQDNLTKSELQNKVETLENTVKELQHEKSSLRKKIETQKNEYEEIIKSITDSEMALSNEIKLNNDSTELNELKTNVSELITKLGDKDKIIAVKNEEINRTKGELEKIRSQQNGTDHIKNDKTINSMTVNDILEEKVFAENQITFLNSIIADMQKKNQEQQARIEILEMGYNASAADELAALGFNREVKIPAPRMYCDICEEFDLHETEDCPTQGDDEPNMCRQLNKESKERPPPRPYCDICEEFGHETQDCTNVDQEF